MKYFQILKSINIIQFRPKKRLLHNRVLLGRIGQATGFMYFE